MTLDLRDILSEPVDWRHKSWPVGPAPVAVGDVGGQHWNALSGDFSLPVLVLRESALENNLRAMEDYVHKHEVSLAPHVKTPASPQIAARQISHGAWGISVANVHQARLFYLHGFRRILMANELLDPPGLDWVAGRLDEDPDFEFWTLVDSAGDVELADKRLAAAGASRQLSVLVELGIVGGRSGCRSVEEALDVARRVVASNRLKLTGVEAYENVAPVETFEEKLLAVDELLSRVRRLAEELAAKDLVSAESEMVISVGGSLFFDRVADALAHGWRFRHPHRIVLRCGSYVTHDAGVYEQYSPLAGRAAGGPRLKQALELWAFVLSRPEPGLAVMGFGKRDVGHDRGMPVPFAWRRSGAGEPRPWRQSYEVIALNDQHARMAVPATANLEVGDQIGFHVQHACTTFDKWGLVPLVSDDYEVLDAIRCYL